MKQISLRKTGCSVQIQYIRGEEAEYTLDRDSFQYVRDPVPEIKTGPVTQIAKRYLLVKQQSRYSGCMPDAKVDVEYNHSG